MKVYLGYHEKSGIHYVTYAWNVEDAATKFVNKMLAFDDVFECEEDEFVIRELDKDEVAEMGGR